LKPDRRCELGAQRCALAFPTTPVCLCLLTQAFQSLSWHVDVLDLEDGVDLLLGGVAGRFGRSVDHDLTPFSNRSKELPAQLAPNALVGSSSIVGLD
jgi:hypothetical protein